MNPINSEYAIVPRDQLIRLFAYHYQFLGLNVGVSTGKNVDWMEEARTIQGDKLFIERQNITSLANIKWDEISLLGLIAMVDRLVSIVIYNKTDRNLQKEFFHALGIPKDYEWLFKIMDSTVVIINTAAHELEHTNEVWEIHHENWGFTDSIAIDRSVQLPVPPSIYQDQNLSFEHCFLPSHPPMKVKSSAINNLFANLKRSGQIKFRGGLGMGNLFMELESKHRAKLN